MKAFIRKNAISLVMGLAAVNLLLLILIFLPKGETVKQFKKLDIKDAAPRIEAYQKKFAENILTPCSSGKFPLRSVAIPVSNLRESILEDHLFGYSTNIVDQILVMPLMENNHHTSSDPMISFAFIGVDKNGNILTDRMYNYCDPCPKACNKITDKHWEAFEVAIRNVSGINPNFAFAKTCK